MRSIPLLAFLLFPTAAQARPPLLEVPSECESWVGSASGNDPTVRLQLELCPKEDGAVSGRVQWSSERSGWNVREVEGRWSGDALVLSDLGIVDNRPRPGWRFCTIDRYELLRSQPTTLTGRYVSNACNDHATVSLVRRSGPASTPGPAPAPAPGPGPDPGPPPAQQPPAQPPSPPPAQPPTPPPAPPPSTSDTGGCTAAGARPAAAAPIAVAAALLLSAGSRGRGRRRRRS